MTSSAYPLVSVVTPAYNGEPYLRECIESVLAQTYPNWDYTIVNNCSQDRTREIAEEYATRDSRIRVYNNTEFVHVTANHNIAVRLSSPNSKYCKIVAADDWLFQDCLTQMVQLAEANPSVGIVSSYGLRDSGKWVTPRTLSYRHTVLSGREICRATLLGQVYAFGQETSVLYRTDLLRTRYAFFNESNLHADAEVCLEFLQHYDFGFVHQILYFIRTRNESVTSFSKAFNTYLPMNLYFLQKYGPVYLSADELQYRLAQCIAEYYSFLSDNLFQRRHQDFWTFHERKLHDLGLPLNYFRLGAVASMRLLDFILNPKRSLEALARHATRLSRRSRLAAPDASHVSSSFDWQR